MLEFKRPGQYSAANWFRLLSACIIFFALIQFLTLAISLTRTNISQPVALAILAMSAGGAFALDRLFHRLEVEPPADADANMPSPGIFKWLVPLLLFLLGFTFINAYLHPFIFGDCAIYHLPTIHYWGEKGFIHWVDLKPSEVYYTDRFINGYPKAAELMAFVTIHATGVAGLVHLLNAWFLMLGISGVAFLARQFGASAGASLAAGLLYALAPVNMQQLNGTYVDSAFASAMVALFAVMVYFAANKNRNFLSWYTALVFGACAGLVLGIKGSGPLPVGVAGVAVLILLVLHWRRLPLNARPGRWRAFFWLSTILTVAFLVGGYWYVRNLVHTGNPFFPVAIKIGRFVQFPGFPREKIMNEAANIPMVTAGWSDRARVFFNWMQGGPAHWPFSVCSVSGRLGGLGLIWLLGCCPALLLVYFVVRKNRRTSGSACALGALVITTTAIFFMTPMHWWARYTLWLLAAGLPCLVVVAERIWSGRFRKLGLIWSAALLLLFLIETLAGASWLACASPIDWYGGGAPFPARPVISINRLSWNRPFTLIDKSNSGSIYRELGGNSYPVVLGPLDIWKSLSTPMMSMFGMVCDPMGRRPVFLVDRESIRNPAKVRSFLKDQKIRYLIWDAATKCPPVFERLSTRQEEIGPFHYFAFDRLTAKPDK